MLASLPRVLNGAMIGAMLVLGLLTSAFAADETPEAFIKRLSGDVIDAIKTDKSIAAGDINKIVVLVDQKVMPSVNFLRMTAMALLASSLLSCKLDNLPTAAISLVISLTQGSGMRSFQSIRLYPGVSALTPMAAVSVNTPIQRVTQ
jgi:hypothetical protein